MPKRETASRWSRLENGRIVFFNWDDFEDRLRQLSHEIHLEAGKIRSLGLRGELSCKMAGQPSGRLRVLNVLINYNLIFRSTLFNIAHTLQIEFHLTKALLEPTIIVV